MRCDFAVIGGGPAGASAARRLAKAGANVTLFERAPMPRYKPCGGALSRQALDWLDEPIPPELIDRDIFGTRLHVGGAVVESRRPERVAVLVERARFDHYLLRQAEAAGAKVVWQAVRALDVGPDGVRLRAAGGEFTADCAIVCEGAAGRLARPVCGRDPPDLTNFCLQAEIPVPSPDPYADLDGLLGIYMDELDFGYGWVFPHGRYHAVGIGALRSALDDPQAAFRRFVAARGLSLDGARVWGHYLPTGGVQRVVVADRVLLAGDAAGFADPFHGEGVAYAVRSGQLAAKAALEAGARGDFSREALAPYAGLCHEAFGRDLAAAYRLFRLMHGRPAPIIRRVATEPKVLDRFLDVPTARLSYRGFLRWLLLRTPWIWLRALVSGRRRSRRVPP
jgi:geranylgeranyl reductase family protein